MKKKKTHLATIMLAAAFGVATVPAHAAIESGAAAGPPVDIFDVSEFGPGWGLRTEDSAPDIALDADGDGVAVWVAGRVAEDGISGLYARRVHADGSTGEIVTVKELPLATGWLGYPKVAIDADGDAVVTWMQDTDSSDNLTVWTRRIDKDGQLQGEATMISDPDVEAVEPRVGMDAAGNFVIAWWDYDSGETSFRRFDANGNALGDDDTFLAPTDLPVVAMSPKGDFIIAWDGLDDFIHARRYTAGGDFIAPEVEFDAGPDFSGLAVALDADGDFIIAWSGEFDAILAKRFGSDGAPLTDDPPTMVFSGGDEPMINGVAFGIDGDPLVALTAGEGIGEDPINFLLTRVKADGTAENVDLAFDTSCDLEADTECYRPTNFVMDADGDAALSYVAYSEEEEPPFALRVQRYRGAESADLAATLSVSDSEVHPGDSVALTLTIENLHPLGDHYGVESVDSAVGATTGVKLDFTLPDGLETSFSSDDWTCTGEGESASCVYAKPLLAAEEIVLETEFEVPAAALGEYSFSVTVSADRIDPDTDNNASAVTVTVNEPGDDDDPPPPAGSGDGGGGALGWLALLLAPMFRLRRIR